MAQARVRVGIGLGGPPPGAGALLGLWASSGGVYIVDDATNTLNLLH
jgi:hypothetical protein